MNTLENLKTALYDLLKPDDYDRTMNPAIIMDREDGKILYGSTLNYPNGLVLIDLQEGLGGYDGIYTDESAQETASDWAEDIIQQVQQEIDQHEEDAFQLFIAAFGEETGLDEDDAKEQWKAFSGLLDPEERANETRGGWESGITQGGIFNEIYPKKD